MTDRFDPRISDSRDPDLPDRWHVYAHLLPDRPRPFFIAAGGGEEPWATTGRSPAWMRHAGTRIDAIRVVILESHDCESRARMRACLLIGEEDPAANDAATRRRAPEMLAGLRTDGTSGCDPVPPGAPVGARGGDTGGDTSGESGSGSDPGAGRSMATGAGLGAAPGEAPATGGRTAPSGCASPCCWRRRWLAMNDTERSALIDRHDLLVQRNTLRHSGLA